MNLIEGQYLGITTSPRLLCRFEIELVVKLVDQHKVDEGDSIS